MAGSTGGYAANKWEQIKGSWYYFNEKGYAVSGWQLINNNWYYFDPLNSNMHTGWLKCETDNYWYYLDENGAMVTGWQNIKGKWYYFSSVTTDGAAYSYDTEAEKWNYANDSVIPFGAMYENAETPDGYRVDTNGELMN